VRSLKAQRIISERWGSGGQGMEHDNGSGIQEELDRILLEEIGRTSSPQLIEHALRPHNVGALEDPDGEATVSGLCEDTVRIQLRLEGSKVSEIAFMTNGCAATVACASMATELAKGKTIQEALRIDGHKIREALGGLPREHTHCADLAANTLRQALLDALEKKRDPWKKLYRSKGRI
jgi:nitrogen fixation NifU-like protein